MTVEIAALAVLLWIGWTLERVVGALRALETELSTARWERGKRMSDGQAMPTE